MDIRDAVEADAGRLADLADGPPDVMRNLIHDRTVRVAVEEAAADPADEDVRGFVSYDASRGTVHVTQLAGSEAVCERLLEAPIAFASQEGMAVEVLVPEDEGALQTAAEAAGFEHTGAGPQFEGQPTARYRLEPEPVEH